MAEHDPALSGALTVLPDSELDQRPLVVPDDTARILDRGVRKLTKGGYTIRFGEGSLLQRDIGDMRLAASVWSAGLLLAAYPVIGDALVTQSTTYQPEGNIWKRFRTSAAWIGAIATSSDAVEAGLRIREFHKGIRGRGEDGRMQSAMNPEHYAWGWTAIMWMAEQKVKRFHKDERNEAEWEQWRKEARVAYQCQGISDRLLPASYDEYQQRVAETCENRLTRTPAVEQAMEMLERREIHRPPMLPPKLWTPALQRALSDRVKILAYGGLSENMREKLGMPWTAADERRLRRFDATVRALWDAVPVRLRYQPQVAEAVHPPRTRLQAAQIRLHQQFADLDFKDKEAA
jgi:uncharacterized protein (DUF2236 family)